jgi:hypothetical protein
VRKRLLATALLISTLGLLPACGGGSPGTNQVIDSTCLTFEAAASPAPSTIAARQGSGSTCDVLAVELVLTDVSDVLTVAFDVDFDDSLASYQDVSVAGSALGSDAEVLKDPSEGHVTVTLTHLTTGVDFNGTGLLATVVFRKLSGASGSGPLTLSGVEIWGTETPPQLKPGIGATGGTLRVE